MAAAIPELTRLIPLIEPLVGTEAGALVASYLPEWAGDVGKFLVYGGVGVGLGVADHEIQKLINEPVKHQYTTNIPLGGAGGSKKRPGVGGWDQHGDGGQPSAAPRYDDPPYINHGGMPGSSTSSSSSGSYDQDGVLNIHLSSKGMSLLNVLYNRMDSRTTTPEYC